MNESKLSKWSSIAEIFSSIAILITLIYLAVQTQQNTDSLLSNSRQNALDSEVAYLYMLLDRPKLWEGPKLQSNSDYTDDELLEKIISLTIYFRMRENLWLQYDSGVLDARVWEPYLSTFTSDFNTNPFKMEGWLLMSDSLNPNFVNDVNNNIK